MAYRWIVQCPRCHKRSFVMAPLTEPPTVNCGDCLFNDIEVVVMDVLRNDEHTKDQ